MKEITIFYRANVYDPDFQNIIDKNSIQPCAIQHTIDADTLETTRLTYTPEITGFPYTFQNVKKNEEPKNIKEKVNQALSSMFDAHYELLKIANSPDTSNLKYKTIREQYIRANWEYINSVNKYMNEKE